MALISPHHIIYIPLGRVSISAFSDEPCRAGNLLPDPQEGDGVGKLYTTHSAGMREDLPASEFRAKQLFELKPWLPEAATTGAGQGPVCPGH